MLRITEIAEKYGNGTIFITNRQGVEIPGIKIEDMDAVNKELQLIIDESGVNQEEFEGGYPAAGIRLPVREMSSLVPVRDSAPSDATTLPNSRRRWIS